MGSFIDVLLEMFPGADQFVLIGPSATYDHGEMSACFPLSPTKASQLLNQLVSEEKSLLKQYYDLMTLKEKSELPSFDILIDHIKEEVSLHVKKVLGPDESPYACDEFGEGNMRYRQPSSLWHFYHTLGSIYETVIPILDKMVTHPHKLDPLAVFNHPNYERLKHSLIDYQLVFSWHCTKTFVPSISYRFRLDANALVWLSRRRDIYDFDTLDDFGLYTGDTLLFSSCTHERFCDAIGAKNPL
jgi:hypothetical protein